jgi:hypothetical protein
LIIGLSFLFVGGSLGLAQQIMTPVSGPKDPRKAFLDQLDLRRYEAATDDLSLCKGDAVCLDDAKRIKYWFCADAACNGMGKSKGPFDCFERVADNYSKEEQNQINSSICTVLRTPSPLTRRALLTHLSDPNATEGGLVEYGAYLLALKGAEASCEDYIKNYAGTYPSQWDKYRQLSGCRILARVTTRQQEEKDFYTWISARQGSGSCSGIINIDMRKACNTAGAMAF